MTLTKVQQQAKRRFLAKKEACKREFEESGVVLCSYERMERASIADLEAMAVVLKTFLAVAKAEEKLIDSGVIVHEAVVVPEAVVGPEEVPEDPQVNVDLLEALKFVYPPNKRSTKGMKHKYESKEKFRRFVFNEQAAMVLSHVATKPIFLTLDALRDSIDLADYEPTQREYDAERGFSVVLPVSKTIEARKARKARKVNQCVDDSDSDVEGFLEETLSQEHDGIMRNGAALDDGDRFAEKLNYYFGDEIDALTNMNPKNTKTLVDSHVLSILIKCRGLSDETDSFAVLKLMAVGNRVKASRIIKKRYLNGPE